MAWRTLAGWLANTNPGRLTTYIPYSFYPETEWRSDLELGATELYLALASGGTLPPGLPHTDPRYYLQQAAHWAAAYIASLPPAQKYQPIEAHRELDRLFVHDTEAQRAVRDAFLIATRP